MNRFLESWFRVRMKRDQKIIVISLVVLLATTAVGAIINRHYAGQRADLLKAAEIIVSEQGKEVSRLNMDTIGRLPTADFKARLKSSVMKSPEEHTYTGIAFSDLLAAAGISLEGKSRVVVHSVDGYAVPLTIKEIKAFQNVYLVYRDNGDYLGSYDEVNGQGPYMVVIRGDRFSQRWAKFVCELDIQ